MSNRAQDWLRQAQRDMEVARASRHNGLDAGAPADAYTKTEAEIDRQIVWLA